MLKEVASLEEYNEVAALPKRRREDPHLQHTTLNTTYAQPQSAYSLQSATQAAGSGTGIRSPLDTANQVSMTHSMAITPVASMTGAASFSPLTQEPAAAAPMTMPMQSMPMYSYNPAPNPLATDWDLGNLLMMQMGYSHYEPPNFSVGQGVAGQQAHGAAAQMQQAFGLNQSASNSPLPQQGDMSSVPLQQAATTDVQPSGQGSSSPENTSASPESFGNTEDLLSLFSDVPMAFRSVSIARPLPQ